MDNRPTIDSSQMYYARVVHLVAISSCVIALAAPLVIMLFPHNNILNPALALKAIFGGKRPAEVWAAAGTPFIQGGFWKLFLNSFFAADGLAFLGIILGCGATLVSMLFALWQFAKKREIFFACAAGFTAALIALAMSGIANMAG